LAYTGPLPERVVFVENMVLDHYPDSTKSRSSYLPLLETAVEENPADTRMLYYLGREYMYQKQWQNCIDTMKRYLALSHWEEERSAAMRWSAYSWNMLRKPQEAARWYLRAIAETPQMRDPYVEFAQMAYQQKNWPLVYCLTRQAFTIREKSKNFANMGYAWDSTPEDLCSIACWNLKLPEEALEHSRRAVELSPDNERLQTNLRLITTAIEKKSFD
jgi:tetratricopeptide (TPR) repeat protein